MNDNPPTLAEVLNKKTSYETYYSQLHTDQKKADTFYELTFLTGVPKRFHDRKPSTSRQWVDNGVNNFTLDNPKSFVAPTRKGDKPRELAGKKAAFYDFWLNKDRPVIKIGAKKILIRGECFFKLNMDDQYFGSYKGQKLSELSEEQLAAYRDERLTHFPLYLSCPDPINVFPSPAHDGVVPADVIEAFYITIAEANLLCLLNGWNWYSERDPTSTVEWVSYIDPQWRFFSIDNQPLLEGDAQENIFGFVPYVHFGAGYGQTSFEGKPEYLYRSLLYPKQDELIMEARMMSWIDAQNSRYAWQRYKARGNPELIKQHYPKGVPTDPDELLIEIPNQLEIEVEEGKSPPQGLFQEYAMLQQKATPPAAMAGQRLAGVYSAQQQEGLQAAGKTTYKEPFKNMEHALGVILGMGARVIEQVYKHPIQFKNLSSDDAKQVEEIKPTDFNGHYDVEVMLLAEPPEATDVRKGLGASLWSKGAISKRKMQTDYFDMSEGEADEDTAQQIAENALLEPRVRDVVAMDATEQLGMDKAQEQLELATQQAEGLGFMGQGGGVRRIPPKRQGEGITLGGELLTKRGRAGEGVEPLNSPREQIQGAG